MNTLLLDTVNWDLVIDAAGNMAMASNPYALAQDAASNVKTFSGEVYYDTTLGIPYFTAILGQFPPASLIKKYWSDAAAQVPDVVAARAFITGFVNRKLTGQVQLTNEEGRIIGAANF